jgi:hypothetical protein
MTKKVNSSPGYIKRTCRAVTAAVAVAWETVDVAEAGIGKEKYWVGSFKEFRTYPSGTCARLLFGTVFRKGKCARHVSHNAYVPEIMVV